MENNDTLLALAEKLREWFPDLNGQAAAVTEAEFTKETAPPLPFAMVALVNTTFESSENNKTVTYVVENILINFLVEINRYKKQDGSESPFWAHYPYKDTTDKLIYYLSDWVSPSKATLTLVQFELDATNFAAVLSYRLRHRYKAYYNPGQECEPLVLTDGRPLQIFGSSCAKLEVCETTCCEEETDKCQKST